MIRHFGFIEGAATIVPPDRCVLVVESKGRGMEADGTSCVRYSACYKDNPGLSYEFSSNGQFRHWLDAQGRIKPLAEPDL